MLFAVVILSKYCLTPHWTEWLLIAWTASLIFEEIRQILHEPGSSKVTTWWSDLYNKFDFIGYLLFILGFSIKFYAAVDQYGLKILTVKNNAIENCPLNLDGEFRIAHFIYCFSFITLMIRMLNFYSNSRNLGPKVIMITRMFMDMVQFLALLIIFILAYGIATQA